jgi:DNA mismatch endonuclease (patch repair protein)
VSDVFTKAKRSEVMSRIRGRGNKATELALAKLFRRHSITGWRRNQKIFGKPDFIFPKLKLAMFVDGCFWHGCPKHGTQPKGNAAFWRNKITRNRTRDRLVTRTLRQTGWRVLRIWEHELASKNESKLVERITHARKWQKTDPSGCGFYFPPNKASMSLAPW